MENLPKYQLYQSETTGKYFVKYPESEEKEIGVLEYNHLKEEKNRILDLYLHSEKKYNVIHENKSKNI
jgi:hypothetical protein